VPTARGQQTSPPGRMRRQHSVVQHQVNPGSRRQRCQSFQQLHGIKAQVCRPVAPAVAQLWGIETPLTCAPSPLPHSSRISAVKERGADGASATWARPAASAARDVRERGPAYAVAFVALVDDGDVRVFRFALGAREPLRLLRDRLHEHFDGNVASELRVTCAVDHSHPAWRGRRTTNRPVQPAFAL
jgi:hypothetical protein